MPDALERLVRRRRGGAPLGRTSIGAKSATGEAADAFADGAITAEQLRRISALVQPDLDEAEHRRAQSVVSLDLDSLRPLAGPTARQCWDEMAVAQRRAVLGVLGIRVIVDRRDPGPVSTPRASALNGRAVEVNDAMSTSAPQYMGYDVFNENRVAIRAGVYALIGNPSSRRRFLFCSSLRNKNSRARRRVIPN